MKDNLRNEVEEIIIPEAVKNLPIDYFDFSVRLDNVLRRLNVELLGDLQGTSFDEIEHTRNCGQKTIDELREFIERLQDENSVEMLDENYQQKLEDVEKCDARNELIEKKSNASEELPSNFIKTTSGKIFVPQSVKDISIKCFALSVRLENVLDSLNIKSLGDLEMFSVKEIKQTKNCGWKTQDELQSFIVRIQRTAVADELPEEIIEPLPTELDLNGLLNFINSFLIELPDRERQVILSRFGGTSEEKGFTLGEIGEKLGVTRERVRQIESKNIKEFKSRLTSVSDAVLQKLNDDCIASVCPLTTRFLIHLTGDEFSLFEYPPGFYLRLLSELSPDIPIFDKNQSVDHSNKTVKKMRQEIKNQLDSKTEFLSLAEVFNRISYQFTTDNLVMKHFFEAVKANEFIIEPGDSPDVLLISTDKNRLTMVEMARQVLGTSKVALKPREIVKLAGEMFGDEVDLPSEGRVINLPFYEQDFYLLDRKTIGLRKHFRLPEGSWHDVKRDFYELLIEKNCPISTSEVINKSLFGWTSQTTASEAAAILREDEQFKDLGRFLFALTKWQIDERESVKDLIVRALQDSDKPLTATEISNYIQNFRSITPTSMSTILRSHLDVNIFGFGYYGLKSKGNQQEFFLTDKKFLNRLIKSLAPLTFAELCRRFNIADNDENSQKLWAAMQTIPKLRFAPNYYMPETIISYKKW